MDFELTDDQLALQDNARSVLASACPSSLVREVYDDRGSGSSATARDSLWRQLVALDWPALSISPALGGMGLGFVETAVVVEELGRVVAPSPYLATVTQFAAIVREAGTAAHHEAILSRVADGSLTGTLAVAETGGWQPAGIQATAERSGDAWTLTGTKQFVLDGATAQELAVVARAPGSSGDDGLGVFVIPSSSAATTALDVIDPTMPVATVVLDGVEVPSDRVLIAPGDPRATTAIHRALHAATTAMALSTVATCRAIFETTLQYAKDREQFGRPIGSFQALKHRLADMYLAVEKASSLAYFAALTIAEDDDRRAQASSMAKAAAGDCQRLLVGDGLQLHGGIGFTWEHDLHFLLKRAKSGDALFGTSASHRRLLGQLMGLSA